MEYLGFCDARKRLSPGVLLWSYVMQNRIFFIDMNAFFASVEQQEQPALRGKPVIVTPIDADTTCAIAASYEAKAKGIKAGTGVREARQICPDVCIVQAHPKLYLQYHAGIVETLMAHFVYMKTLSVDEMACTIARFYSTPEAERKLAERVKGDLQRNLGPMIRSSVGIAPNVFLAKVASDMQKPDGLTMFASDLVPQSLYPLDLQDLPGIGSHMYLRLIRQGITSVRQLCEATPGELRRVWGGVVGERWWHMLRGSQIADYGVEDHSVRKTVGQSHVMPPEYRTQQGAREILIRLFTKALKRMRRYEQAASSLYVYVEYRHIKDFSIHVWKERSMRHLPANDDITWMKTLRPLLERMPDPPDGYRPFCAGITFTDLVLCQDRTLDIFEEREKRERLAQTVDRLNARFGDAVELASSFWMRNQAPLRIPFGSPDSV
jgi:DNA polymerase-4